MNYKNKTITSLSLSLLFVSGSALADSKWVRLGWDGNASKEATVSFTPDGRSNNPYLSYGYSTTESSWENEDVTFTTSMESITSNHVRLNNLTANSPVHFRICDDDGCGERFWFKTAPSDNTPFVFIAGGDTRSGWTNRQDGNRLVAKVRPLFVMHGGDFTNDNDNPEWSQWFQDWELSYSDDTINGISYKRIYPLISTHGNHEDDEIETICKMLGVNPTRSNDCSANDTYYSTEISPLLRVYTLNSQFMEQSSSLQNAQNNWLQENLSASGTSSRWRIAQYHKPMFPHYTGKRNNEELFDWWAGVFFEYGMNIVVESDTHITKVTEIVEPRGDDFAGTDEGVTAGTVYVGEGSWGAPARSANSPKSWTVDLASIQQFKVMTVSNTGLDVRTAQFDSSASTLSKSDRDANTTILPNDVNWWAANGIGEVLELEQDDNNRTVLKGSQTNASQVSLSAVEDSFIASGTPSTNYGASNEQLLSDGADSVRGVIDTLIKWDLSSIPSCYAIESASVQINVFNSSPGSYGVYAGNSAWSENSVNWDSVNGADQQGLSIAAFNPSEQRTYTVDLNANGLSMVESWLQGNNNGIVISSIDTTNGIDFNDRENTPEPQLILTYNEDQCSSAGIPTAGFNFAINEQTVSFNDTSQEDRAEIVAWLWDFGDSETSAQINPIHTYTEGGTYSVRLTVTDANGASATSTEQVSVAQVNTGSITVSASSNDGNIPSNVLQDPLTRWSANGVGEWLQIEFPSEVTASGMDIAFFRGDLRQSSFTLQVSSNGTTWTNATGQLNSSGNTLETETFSFSQVQSARFFRYLGSGNSTNLWNSITLLSVTIDDNSNNSPAEIQIDDIEVTASDKDGNRTLDNDDTTRWSTEGDGQWLQYDLGQSIALSKVLLRWYKGDLRVASFDIEVSADGNSWSTAFTGQSSGSTKDYETLNITRTDVRYIRLTGFGNTSNSWNSLSDIQVFGVVD